MDDERLIRGDIHLHPSGDPGFMSLWVSESIDRYLTGRINRQTCSVRKFVKTVFGLFALMLIAAAFWMAKTPPDQSQIGAGPAEVPGGIYDPVRAGEPTPAGFRQLLPRDAIHPVYNPTFRSAESTEWSAGTLVIGLELNGEAKAYPVSFLNFREMVIDWIGGSPVLVTW